MRNALARHFTCFLAVLLVFQVPVAETAAAQGKEIAIPAGTPVEIRFDESVSSATHKVGETVRATAARDVVVEGQTVIRARTPVQARVSHVKKNSALGSPGEIGIVVESVSAVDNSVVLLSARCKEEGDSQLALALVLGVLVCLPFLLIKGKKGTIEGGTVVSGATASTVSVRLPT